MTRVSSVPVEKSPPKVRSIYDALEKKIGRVPNIFLNMGNAPAVLEGYLALGVAANRSSLNPLLREQIALAVAEANSCNYCLAAHSAIGKQAGLSDADILLARKGGSSIPKNQAIIHFAKLMVEKKGQFTNEEVDALKKAGVSDQEMLEIVLVVMQNLFTNYFNHLTDPVIDFPKVEDI